MFGSEKRESKTRFRHVVALWVLAFLLIAPAGIAEQQSSERNLTPRPEDFPNMIVPLWAFKQTEPEVRSHDMPSVESHSSSTACSSTVEISLERDRIGIHFDSMLQVTEFLVSNSQREIERYEIDSALNVSMNTTSMDSGSVWIAEDLNGDGNIEVLIQWADELKIYSAPDWTLRNRFVISGMPVVMHPVAVNLDDDSDLEVFVPALSLGSSGRILIIDYNPISDSFEIIEDFAHTLRLVGQSAVGDFDNDGRVEFIIGMNFTGYGLLEWQEDSIVYIGFIGDTLQGNVFAATACRPKPGGELHALLGSSYGPTGYRYDLVEPTGDNTFQIIHTFQQVTGTSGRHPSGTADVDCDGLDELAMHFGGAGAEVWGWEDSTAMFKKVCSWDVATFGSVKYWYDVDLNQDGVREFAAARLPWGFIGFQSTGCVQCDSLGVCPENVACDCYCFGDPVCDSVTDVFDVLAAV